MEVTITTAAGLPVEQAVAAELTQLRGEHDLDGLEWTDQVVVETHVVPHSHPVLTLNTRRSGDGLLASYLHEQLHWWLHDHPSIAAAIDATREKWPTTPSAKDGGARSDWSSRLHLLLCCIEHQEMRLLVGPVRATGVIEEQIEQGLYSWIRRRVQVDAADFGRLCAAYDLLPPRLDPAFED